MKRFLLLVSFLFLLFGSNNACLAQSKKEIKQQEYQETKKLVEAGQFVFESDWVITQEGNRLTSIGEGLLIEDGKTYANLPFVGKYTRANIGGKENFIKFATANTDFNIQYKDKKQKIIIQYEAQNGAEHFVVFLTIQRNGITSLQISSNYRDNMRYEGKIKDVTISSL